MEHASDRHIGYAAAPVHWPGSNTGHGPPPVTHRCGIPVAFRQGHAQRALESVCLIRDRPDRSCGSLCVRSTVLHLERVP